MKERKGITHTSFMYESHKKRTKENLNGSKVWKIGNKSTKGSILGPSNSRWW